MAKGLFTIKGLVYSDASTNSPIKRNFDYSKDISIASLSSISEFLSVLVPGNNTFNLPASTCDYIYLETDQPLILKFNGSTDAVVAVAPTTVGNLLNTDGVLFKKGEFTSLIINNAAIVNANVLIFVGAQ